jgi:hypothetical protein
MRALSALHVAPDRVAALRDELRASCEVLVVRWQWATADCGALAPYRFERLKRRPGRPLKKKPAVVKRGACESGHDADGRIVVKRIQMIDGPSEELFERCGSVVDSFYFFSGQQRCTATRHWFEDDSCARLTRLERCYDSGEVCVETYGWEGPRLVRISSRGGGHDFDDDLEHDDLGLRRIVRHRFGDGRGKEQYLRVDSRSAIGHPDPS